MDKDYPYHQEYVNQKGFHDSDTISNELPDDEQNSSFRTENSKLSFEEIDQEYESKNEIYPNNEKFDQPSLDLAINPSQMISDRSGQMEDFILTKEDERILESEFNNITQGNLENKKKRSTSRSGKRVSNFLNTDIEDEIKKRGEKLHKIKHNISTYTKNESQDLRSNDTKRKYK